MPLSGFLENRLNMGESVFLYHYIDNAGKTCTHVCMTRYACKGCGSTEWYEIGSKDGVERCNECGFRSPPRLVKDYMERDIYAAYGSGKTADTAIQNHRIRKANIEAKLGPVVKDHPSIPKDV